MKSDTLYIVKGFVLINSHNIIISSNSTIHSKMTSLFQLNILLCTTTLLTYSTYSTKTTRFPVSFTLIYAYVLFSRGNCLRNEWDDGADISKITTQCLNERHRCHFSTRLGKQVQTVKASGGVELDISDLTSHHYWKHRRATL